MRRLLSIASLLAIGCYQPQRLPSPLPASLAEQFDLAFEWIATTLDTTEGRGRSSIRLLASQGPTVKDGWQKPFVHDSSWLQTHDHTLGVSGVCAPPFNECFPEGGFLLAVGLPSSPESDASYIRAQFSLYAPRTECPPPPGTGGKARTAPPWRVYTYYWNLHIVRTTSGTWAIDSTNAFGNADSFWEPCAHAA